MLPFERDRGRRPADGNRLCFEGTTWMARTGARWRHLPNGYEKRHSVFPRYRRWIVTGVFDTMPEMLAAAVGCDASADMIDGTAVRAHHCAVEQKRGSGRLGARPIARQLHHQASRPLRRTEKAALLCPDAGPGARRAGFWAAVPDAG